MHYLKRTPTEVTRRAFVIPARTTSVAIHETALHVLDLGNFAYFHKQIRELPRCKKLNSTDNNITAQLQLSGRATLFGHCKTTCLHHPKTAPTQNSLRAPA
jgi:hypothetical protein